MEAGPNRGVFSSLTAIFIIAFGCIPGAGASLELIDDFEETEASGRWWSYDEDGKFNCEVVTPGYDDSSGALRLDFDIPADNYPGCGVDVDGVPWSGASGLAFVWRSDQQGLTIEVVLQMEDAGQTNPDLEGRTPFAAVLESPGPGWTPVTLPWAVFAKAEWVGASGADYLDPNRVVELLFEVAESQRGAVWIDDLQLMQDEDAAAPAGAIRTSGMEDGKYALWVDGPHLRGANIWQRVVVPEVDGTEFLGSGRVGPPFVQQDFDRLAELGANYVNISTAGLFTERPPYGLDTAIQEHLDELLDMIKAADMFAVISFRTGPGRSDFTFYREGIEEWGDASLLNDQVWTQKDAQDAWVEMWRHTARRYRDHAVVVGYDLMVEPNAEEVFFGFHEPEEFFGEYNGTLYDWNQLHPRIAAAIREVDPATPILVGPSGYSGVAWLPYLEPTGDPRTVYTVHHYEPYDFTHQIPPLTINYPGSMDLNYDGEPDIFDLDALERLLFNVDAFRAKHGVAITVNEFGPMRWQPGAAEFMRDQMELFERRGINYALWVFNPSWPPYQDEEDDAFDFLHGPNPDHHTVVGESDLLDIIKSFWARNTVRPSTLRAQ